MKEKKAVRKQMPKDDSEKKEFQGQYRIKIYQKKGILTKFTVYNNISSSFNLFWVSLNIFLVCGFFLKEGTLNIQIILSKTFNCIAFLIIIVVINLISLNYDGNKLKKESLIITKNVGVLIEKKMINGKSNTQFFCISNMRDLIMNEGMTPYDVRYYLVLIAKDENHLIQLFSSFNLRLADLLKIYYPARMALLGDIQKK
ncbi:hypothetical protein ABPG72_009043 [Tetrahymena utriculariae]